jgi:hypothetical protein
MKDKLVKTGHKKGYYRFVSTMKGFGFSLLAVIALASPVLIAMDMSTHTTKAEEVQVSTPEEESIQTSSYFAA